ncbi:MAG: type II toxin-antitoxin system VapC family toxin [Thermoprotei archaeon]|nr:MAG: type II toxin-antitoxin system VapC family toxin [Thermoprotei archaeon]
MKLIETSWLIEMLKRGVYEEGAISIISLTEVLRGIRNEKRDYVKRFLEESFDILGLDNDIIRVYCDLYDRLKDRGELIPDADLLVASTAIARGLTLKSRDKHFNRLRDLGLSLELVE